MRSLLRFTAPLIIAAAACSEAEKATTPTTVDESAVRFAVAPAQITAPFYGPYHGSTTNTSNVTAWYDYPGSSGHKRYNTYDDSYAYDFNLRDNLDQNLPVVAVASGTVVTWSTLYTGTADGGTFGAVLIDHGGWYSGYLHMRSIKVKKGDKVQEGQEIGTVWNRSNESISQHLHFVVYDKTKVSGRDYLTSRRVTFRTRDFSLPLPAQVDMRLGESRQMMARVPFLGGRYTINDPYLFNSTWWTSDNTRIATVSGDGRITSKARGQTNIRLRFSGKVFVIPVKVS